MNLPAQFEEWAQSGRTREVAEWMERTEIPRLEAALMQACAKSCDPAVVGAHHDLAMTIKFAMALKGAANAGKNG